MKPVPLNQILDAAKLRAIRVQAAVVRDGQFFLAGGTALGLRLRHRRSRDLDWFTAAGFDAADLGKRLGRLTEKPTKMEQEGPSTIRAFYGELETSFIRYTQVPATPESLRLSGVEIPVADLSLIAAMKAAALHDRGKRRDFIDIHAIAKQPGWSVARFIEHASTRLPLLPEQVARSLTYFVEADADDEQPMGYATPWATVKKDLVQGVREWERDRLARAAVERAVTLLVDGRALHCLGIHPETIDDQRFAGRVKQGPDGTVAFPFGDGAGAVGALLVGEGARPALGKQEAGIWRSAERSTDNVLVLVDSPVEALSYHQANPNPRARYVAVGQNLDAEREALIRELATKMSSGSQAVLALPATSRGSALAARIEALLPERKHSRHLPPRGRSWASFVQEQEREWIRARGLRPPGRDRGR
jgi:hypothetical protein